MDATYNLNGGFKPTIKRFADLDGPDFFPTPPWATYALIDNERFRGEIWEPACGDGSMARVLEQTGCPVIATDLYDRGYGAAGYDFLRPTRYADNIVTNPPYNSAEGVVRNDVSRSRRRHSRSALSTKLSRAIRTSAWSRVLLHPGPVPACPRFERT
jgi:hypothetical protein